MTASAPSSPSLAAAPFPPSGGRHRSLVRTAVRADDGFEGVHVAPCGAEGFTVDWQLGPRPGERS